MDTLAAVVRFRFLRKVQVPAMRRRRDEIKTFEGRCEKGFMQIARSIGCDTLAAARRPAGRPPFTSLTIQAPDCARPLDLTDLHAPYADTIGHDDDDQDDDGSEERDEADDGLAEQRDNWKE